MEMQDIPAICKAAHAHGAIVLMDNTWATAIYFDAHAMGVDYSVQAGTKYFAGHSDVLIGSVSARTPDQYKILKESWHTIGSIVAPEDAFLTLRGLRTLHIRLPEHQKSALAMAKWFQARPEVARVMYPALPSDPGHALWKRDFKGATGLFSIELKPVSRAGLAALSIISPCSAWAHPGAAMKALCCHLMPRPIARRRSTSLRGRPCGSISGLRILPICRPIWSADSSG